MFLHPHLVPWSPFPTHSPIPTSFHFLIYIRPFFSLGLLYMLCLGTEVLFSQFLLGKTPFFRSQLQCYFVKEAYPGTLFAISQLYLFLQGMHHDLYPCVYLWDYLLLSVSLSHLGRNNICAVLHSILGPNTGAETQKHIN